MQASMEARKIRILLCTASISAFFFISFLFFFFFFVFPLLPPLKPFLLHLLYRVRDILAFLTFTAAIAAAIFKTQKKSGKEEAKTAPYSFTASHHFSTIFCEFQEEVTNFLLEDLQENPQKGLFHRSEKIEITRSCDDLGSNTKPTQVFQRKVSLLHRRANSFDELLNNDSPNNEAKFDLGQTLIDKKVNFSASQSLTTNPTHNNAKRMRCDNVVISTPLNATKSMLAFTNEEQKIECDGDDVSLPLMKTKSIFNVKDEDQKIECNDSVSIRSRTRISSLDVKNEDQKTGRDHVFSSTLMATNTVHNVKDDEYQTELDGDIESSPNEINRKADAFIARVNNQIRLQNVDSFRRHRNRIA